MHQRSFQLVISIKIIDKMLYLFLCYVFEIECDFYTFTTSRFARATLQVPHMWPVVSSRTARLQPGPWTSRAFWSWLPWQRPAGSSHGGLIPVLSSPGPASEHLGRLRGPGDRPVPSHREAGAAPDRAHRRQRGRGGRALRAHGRRARITRVSAR